MLHFNKKEPGLEETLAKEPKVSVFVRLTIVFYELGDLSRDLFYANRFPNEAKAHLSSAKLSLGDLFAQLSLLCRELGWNEEEVRNLGWKHLRERFQEFERREWIPLEVSDAP